VECWPAYVMRPQFISREPLPCCPPTTKPPDFKYLQCTGSINEIQSLQYRCIYQLIPLGRLMIFYSRSTVRADAKHALRATILVRLRVPAIAFGCQTPTFPKNSRIPTSHLHRTSAYIMISLLIPVGFFLHTQSAL
jgi:hypothetical protein